MANGDIWNPKTRMYESIEYKKPDKSPVSVFTARFCFVCGSKLKDAEHDWIQCSSEDCGEMFRINKDSEGNRYVFMLRTPFTPK